MTFPIDLLNRPPVMRPIPPDEIEIELSPDEDWMGEGLIRKAPKDPNILRGHNMKTQRPLERPS